MKIAIFSDTHLGFDKKGERSDESFENLEQAIKLGIENASDFAVLSGDIFDEPVPSHTSLFRGISSFASAKRSSNGTKLTIEKNNETREIGCNGFPLLTIHGNHEYRGKEFKTALDVLDIAGLLVYFHAGKIIAEKDGESVCVFGLGAVPEKRALDILSHWNPLPVKGSCNILLLHQGFKDVMAFDDDMIATLSLSDLPKGFDLIVNGHLHWSNEQQLGPTKFLLPGSTIATSIKRLEAEKPKGVFFFDTKTKGLSFKEFPRQRKMFYHKIVFKDADIETVLAECVKTIEADLSGNYELKPLLRLNLKGNLKKGLSSGDVNIEPLFGSYSGKAILSISKNFSSVEFRKKISELREAQKEKLSVASLGFELLEKNLGETDFGEGLAAKKLFELLDQNDIDGALELATKR